MEVLQQLELLIAEHSLIAAFVLIVSATLVSEDLTCIGCGLLVARGDLGLATALASCIFGLWFGDLTLYGWGTFVGRPALKRRPLRWWFSPEDVEKCAAWYRRRGSIVIFLARVVPGCRLPTYFAAGLLKAPFWRFTLDCLIACALWVPLLVGLAVFVGEGIFGYFEVFKKYALVSSIALLFALYLVVKLVIPLFTYRGRRLLRGSFRRKVRWEFWSSYAFYPPIVAYILYLSIRHRSLSLFTTVNPAIFAGGFVNESKTEILEGLTADPDNHEFVARIRRVAVAPSADDRLAEVKRFFEETGLDYPVVLKPDAGQRGSGVAVVRSNDEARSYLATTKVEVIVQEFAPGAEFGVFYYRYPDEERGHVFSITEKEFPTVVGDGERTIERLILAEDALLPMARFYFKKLGSRLFETPPAGHVVQLVEIGNHCRGAVFRDGIGRLTPELERTIDRVSRRYDGFYFGRYDVRTPDVEDFMRGENFKVVELNGATSEATHIYDPSLGLMNAYRVLFEQWRILFRIASLNRSRGVRVVPLRELARLVVQYRMNSRTHPA